MKAFNFSIVIFFIVWGNEYQRSYKCELTFKEELGKYYNTSLNKAHRC